MRKVILIFMCIAVVKTASAGNTSVAIAESVVNNFMLSFGEFYCVAR